MARGIIQGAESNVLTVMLGAYTEINAYLVGDRGEQIDVSAGQVYGYLYSEEARNNLVHSYEVSSDILIMDDGGMSEGLVVGNTYYLYLAYKDNSEVAPTWDLSNNTVAQYKMNDSANDTNVEEEEGSIEGVSTVNTNVLSTTGKINQAFQFDGATQKVSCEQDFQTVFQSPFSMSFWAKPDDGQPASIQAFCGVRHTTNVVGIEVNLQTDGKVRVIYGDNTTFVYAKTNAAVFVDGATSWKHITVTVDESQITIYVDGSSVTLDATDDGDMTGEVMANYSLANSLSFGATTDEGTVERYLDGAMDDLRLFDRVLTQTEIDGLYNSGSGTEGSDNGTPAQWTISTTSSQIIIK
ncbi:MAG: hypothetical protein GF334_12390 [Candidatus Altiarchaeales archaeon]|nr:hypothetical protein [Candidatus Altiarchaeales archaeon]